MRDNEKLHDLEKAIRTLPEPDYDKQFTEDTQNRIHENVLQFASSYEKKKKRVTIMKKISLGLVSVAALVLFAILTLPINEESPSSSDPNEQTPTDENVVDHEKEVFDQNKGTEILYVNTEYGFTFTLPKSWDDYQIVLDSWEGISEQNNTMEHGPMLSIRHPQWSEEKPRQDIPILVFTLTQWSSLEKGEFHIGAAPVGPTLLGQNNEYVFALPARYNFAFLEGYEEVETILANQPLQPNEER